MKHAWGASCCHECGVVWSDLTKDEECPAPPPTPQKCAFCGGAIVLNSLGSGVHQCPQPQKLETGERLGDQEAAKAHAKDISPAWTDEFSGLLLIAKEKAFLAGCKHKEAQMRGEIEKLKEALLREAKNCAQLQDERNRMERVLGGKVEEIAELKAMVTKLSPTNNQDKLVTDLDFKNGKPFSASDEYLYSKKIEELKAEIAELKEGHDFRGRVIQVMEESGAKLLAERDAALASKAAAEGALEKIAQPMPGFSPLFAATIRQEIAREALKLLKGEK